MSASIRDNQELWEARYQRGEGRLRYPFDAVVSFVLQTLRKASPPAAVLDFGCGAGNHLWFLVENRFAAYGVDAAPTAVLLSREAIARTDLSYPLERVALMEGGVIPFAAALFDAVIDRSSLGQNRIGEIRPLIAEIHRVLKPGGRYFGINFSDRHPDLVYGNDLGSGDYGDFRAGVFKGIGSRHFFGVAEIPTLFDRFEIDDIRLLSEVSTMGRGAIEQIIVQARKPG